MLLAAASITKSFAGVRALKGVSFDLRPGEVHALVGENGAGKSTLIKIVTGAEVPDGGTLVVHGRAVARNGSGPRARARHRRHLSAALALSRSDRRREHRPGARNRRALAAARLDRPCRTSPPTLLERIGASIDPARLVETLSMPEQQIVEIAKAIGADARIVVMDEPTASLTEREVESLFARHRAPQDARRRHHLHLASSRRGLRHRRPRDGAARRGDRRYVRAWPARSRCAHKDDGRPRAVRGLSQAAGGARRGRPRACEDSRTGRRASPTSRSRCGQGEILGLAGLVGSGRTQLAEILFGLTPADAGEIEVHGQDRAADRSPRRHRRRDCLRARGSPPARGRARHVRRVECQSGQPGEGVDAAA